MKSHYLDCFHPPIPRSQQLSLASPSSIAPDDLRCFLPTAVAKLHRRLGGILGGVVSEGRAARRFR